MKELAAVLRRQLPFLRGFLRRPLDGGAGPARRLLGPAPARHLDPGRRRHLRDAGAHGPGADYTKATDLPLGPRQARGAILASNRFRPGLSVLVEPPSRLPPDEPRGDQLTQRRCRTEPRLRELLRQGLQDL